MFSDHENSYFLSVMGFLFVAIFVGVCESGTVAKMVHGAMLKVEGALAHDKCPSVRTDYSKGAHIYSDVSTLFMQKGFTLV